MARHRARSTVKNDRGITLVELLVYMFLAVVVLTIVGSILINSFRAERQVRDAAQSNSTAQLVAESLGLGIRNASAVEVSAPSADIVLLRTRSIDGSDAGSWYCQAWLISGGELRTSRSTAAIPVPDAATAATWTLLATDVEQIGTSPILALTSDERSVDVRLTVGVGKGVPVTLDTVMVAQQPIPATGKVTAPCF